MAGAGLLARPNGKAHRRGRTEQRLEAASTLVTRVDVEDRSHRGLVRVQRVLARSLGRVGLFGWQQTLPDLWLEDTGSSSEPSRARTGQLTGWPLAADNVGGGHVGRQHMLRCCERLSRDRHSSTSRCYRLPWCGGVTLSHPVVNHQCRWQPLLRCELRHRLWQSKLGWGLWMIRYRDLGCNRPPRTCLTRRG